MGLDIYLNHKPTRKGLAVAEKEYEKRSNALYKLPDSQRTDEARAELKAFATENGLSEWGGLPHIEINSALDPEHLFKVGYFRSSYNEGGINSIARKHGIPGLYEIFEPGDRYEFTPNWEKARKIAVSAIEQWRALQSQLQGFRTLSVDFNCFTNISEYERTDADCLKLFMEQWEQKKDDKEGFRSYSNGQGLFHIDGLQVFGIFMTMQKGLLTENMVPKAVLVYKATDPEDAEGADWLDWYIKALEIVVETCDYVLATGEPKAYSLTWSG
jgi:hypothetical protein